MHSEETKEKIRQKALGRKISEETRKKMSEARKGVVSEKKKAHVQSLIENSKKKVIAENADIQKYYKIFLNERML